MERTKKRITLNVPFLLKGMRSNGTCFEIRGKLMNISDGGFSFEADHPFQIGDTIFATIAYKDLKANSIFEVVWKNPSGKLYGARFKSIEKWEKCEHEIFS